MKRILLVIAAATVVVSASACRPPWASSGHGTDDAGFTYVDNDPVQIIRMPDGWPNVATACDGHGHRIYTVGRNNTVPFVVSDEHC
jgi:hypothetical protein